LKKEKWKKLFRLEQKNWEKIGPFRQKKKKKTKKENFFYKT
jgi:hypothetical protein